MARKGKKKQKNAGNGEIAFHPKPGPGQVFARELVGAETGHAKRYRNVNASPLLLAFTRGQLEGGGRVGAHERFACGEIFERQWHVAFATGARDSTDHGVRGGPGGFTEARQDAGRAIERYRARMAPANFRIVRALCGDGYAPAAALRVAEVECHPVGTAFRIREALDDLVHAVTGMRETPRTGVDNARQGN